MEINWDEVPLIQSLEELCSAKEIADMFNAKPRTVYTWRTMGLPYVRIGRIPYFSKTQVVYWLNNYQRTIPDNYAILGIKLAQRARMRKADK